MKLWIKFLIAWHRRRAAHHKAKAVGNPYPIGSPETTQRGKAWRDYHLRRKQDLEDKLNVKAIQPDAYKQACLDMAEINRNHMLSQLKTGIPIGEAWGQAQQEILAACKKTI